MIAWRPTSWKAMFCAEWRGGGGDADGREQPLGIVGRPLQHLHPAHRAADHREQRLDAQRVDQHGLGADHVGDGDHREAQAVGPSGFRVDRGRTGRAHAAADHVRADDEVLCRVERAALADDLGPPAGLAGERVDRGDVLVEGKRVADQDGVGALGVQPPVGAVGDLDLG